MTPFNITEKVIAKLNTTIFEYHQTQQLMQPHQQHHHHHHLITSIMLMTTSSTTSPVQNDDDDGGVAAAIGGGGGGSQMAAGVQSLTPWSWLSLGRIQIPLYTTILLLSVTGNALVILTLIQNRRMRTITNVFLLNLAVSDILLGVLCMPFTLIGTLLRDFVFGEVMCKLLPYLQGKHASNHIVLGVVFLLLLLNKLIYAIQLRMGIFRKIFTN